MKTWREKKNELKGISPNEISYINAVAELVNALYQRRIALGMTQEELALKVKMKQESIARIENSSVIPRIDTVVKIASALGMSVKMSNQGIEEAAAANYILS